MEEIKQKALDFLKSGEYEKAAKLYLQLAVTNPQDENYLISAANCYDRLEDKKVALSLYKKALEVNPQSLAVILNLSTIYYELKKYELAKQFAEKALEIKADNFSALLNLGNVAYAKGEFEEALVYYEKMYALNPNSYNAIMNIANTSYNLGQYLRAIEFAQIAISKRPTHADPYIVAGNCYAELMKTEEAAGCLKKASEIEPNSDWLCSSIAALYQRAGNWKQCLYYAWKALALKGQKTTADDHINFGYMLYEVEAEGRAEVMEQYMVRWEEMFPENPIVEYVCSALRHEQDVTATDLTYVKKLFDGFAASFDEILGELNYRVPEYIAALLKESLKTKLFKKRRILDLGCGTGLCGAAVREYFPNEEFYGVDISEKMLAEAGKKDVYKALYADDMLSFLNGNEEVYHAVMAGDVLTYMGDLKPLFRELAPRIKFDGLLCFSVSKNVYNQNDYYLSSSGRFAHSLSYIYRLLKYCGLEVVKQEEHILRREGAKEVEGYVVLARKTIEVVFE
ncbi:MAG: tetratricopeptide repeat protein [Acetobacter sp.]|nr:tetratricopeptide repeat protein [Acetobacter sp.]